MAQTDLTSLLTGVSSAPISPMAGLNREGRMAQRAQGFSDRMTRGMLQAAGQDPRTLGQQAQAALAQLDINNPEDQPKIMEIVKRVNPERAAVLQAQFAQQGRVRDEESAGLAKEETQRQQFASYLDKTYPDKGYGDLALQGMITPANMKNFIKEAASGKTTTETISENGVNRLVVLDAGGNIVKRYDAEISGTSNPNAPNYFTDEVIKDGKTVSVMFKREGDKVTEVSTLGTTALPKTSTVDLEEIEVTKDDGQTYVQFLDLTKPEGERVVHEQKIKENRVTTEAIDPLTGQKIKYTTLPNGKGRVQFGVTELPKYDIQPQDDGTYNVYNETLGRLEQEGVATTASASRLIAKKQKTQETLNDIERQIGFVNEAKSMTESYWPQDAVIFHPLMKFVPGTDAKYLEKMTETLQSRIARDTLMELREGSSSGASGLGALNLKELELLQNALGNLDPTVGDTRFRKQLDLVKKHYQGFRASLMGRPSDIDWSNPAYQEFTRTIRDAQGKPQTYYTLSDETGAPLTGSDGKPLWYLADIPVKKDK